MIVRRTSKKLYRRLRRNIKELPWFKPGTHIPPVLIFFPPFQSQLEFLDTYYKSSYFLPNQFASQVHIPIAFDADINLADPKSWPIPDYFYQPQSLNGNLNIIAERQLKRSYPNMIFKADYVLCWDRNSLLGSRWMNLLDKKFLDIDRYENPWDGWTWAQIPLLSQIDINKQREIAQQSFSEFLDSLPVYDKSYIFGTGPSLDSAIDYDFSDGYRVVCNTIVKNKALMEHINPHFIVASDAIHHFDNNKHAYQFRLDLEKYLKKEDVYFLTSERMFPILNYHHPEIGKKTIPLRHDIPGINLNLREQLSYTILHNILNSILLPVGSSLADKIYCLGFDGRAPNDELFWINSDANSYSDLKPAIMASHPGFYELIDFDDYAKQQSKNAERIMTVGEALGKKYYCLNKTYIPAFRKRQLHI